MGEKDGVTKESNEKKILDADNTKKVEEGPITVVLKLDLHCDGCAKKVKKSVRYIQGVKTVKADSVSNKLTVTGKVDPVLLKERVEFKTKKKVEIISPKPKKDDEEGVKKGDDKPAEEKSSSQKPKQSQSTTVVLKIPLHCDGCIQKIKRIISKIDGVESVNADANKNLVTVKGTMSTKELIPYLKDKLKRNVDIVPPKQEDNKKIDEKKAEEKDSKKEKEGDNNGTGNKKTNDDEKPVENSTKTPEKTKNDEAKSATEDTEIKKSDNESKTVDKGDGERSKNVDLMNKYEYYRHNPNYIYTMPVYNQNYYNQDYGVSVVSSTHGYGNEGYVNHGYVMEYPRGPPPPPSPMSLHNPPGSESDMFSADNPNACSVM